ncbi:MAG: hypothetical protein OEU32_02485 [Acidimicrobiia bacterium]|nr:hypothetical protein [Acidimicrobiia bacterium]
MLHMGDRIEIVDEAPSAAQEGVVFHALQGLADPPLIGAALLHGRNSNHGLSSRAGAAW